MGRTRAAVAAAEGEQAAPQATHCTEAGSYDDVDPDVYDICHHFDIDPRKMYQLNGMMYKRADTFESDILKLWDSFKNARQPNAVLVKKMQDMENGIFVGKAPKEYRNTRRLREFCKKHSVDPLSKDSLCDALYDRKLRIIRERKIRGGDSEGDGMPARDMEAVLDKLDKDISGANNPSALIMRDIPGIEQATGRWKGIGKLDDAKRGEIVRELSPPRRREWKEPPPSNATKDTTLPAKPPKASAILQSPLQPLGVAAALPLATGLGMPAPKPKAAPAPEVKAFDPALLAQRLLAVSREAPLPTSEGSRAPSPEPQAQRQAGGHGTRGSTASLAAVPSAASAPAARVPPPPVPEPEPVAPKKAVPVLKLSLSAASKQRIAKVESGEPAEAPPEPPVPPGPAAKEKEKPPTDRDKETTPAKPVDPDLKKKVAGMSELQLASVATGRPIEELAKMPQSEVRALVMKVALGGRGPAPAKKRSKSSSSSRSRRGKRKRSGSRSRSRDRKRR